MSKNSPIRPKDQHQQDSEREQDCGLAGRGQSGHGGDARQEAKALQETGAQYVVLARKYRPKTFDDLIGQEAMVTTLKNAFATDRIAQGYMLTGVRGVGKTTTARILARALNYEIPGEIDRPTIDMKQLGVHCGQIMESRHADVLEMDAASNTGIDNIREIIESARYKPMAARYKVYIIDEVHMLSKGAFNALLKTLEEPPEHVKFIFATTEIRKVPVTVLSRCQRFDLRRVDVPLLTDHFKMITLNEGARADKEALKLIARAAEGSVRDGLSILDQAIAVCLGQAKAKAETEADQSAVGKVTAGAVREMLGLADRGRIFDLLEHVFSGAAGEALTAMTALHRDGAEAAQIWTDLAQAVHVTAKLKTVGPQGAGDDLSAEEKRRAETLAKDLSMALLSRAWQMLLKGIEEVARAPNQLSAAEMVLIRLCYTADLPTPDEIIKTLGGAAYSAKSGKIDAGASASRGGETAANETAVKGKMGASVDALNSPPFGATGPGSLSSTQPQCPDGIQDLDRSERNLGETNRAAPAPPWADAGSVGHQLPDDLLTPGAPAAELRDTKAAPTNFAAVIALAGEHRDPKLVYDLEEHVSLVRFEPGQIELFLLPGAPRELANDLREKLNRWTGRSWILALSNRPGEPAVGQLKRDEREAQIAQLRKDPAVKAVLDAFPEALIKDVHPVQPIVRVQEELVDEDDSATG